MAQKKDASTPSQAQKGCIGPGRILRLGGVRHVGGVRHELRTTINPSRGNRGKRAVAFERAGRPRLVGGATGRRRSPTKCHRAARREGSLQRDVLHDELRLQRQRRPKLRRNGRALPACRAASRGDLRVWRWDRGAGQHRQTDWRVCLCGGLAHPRGPASTSL